MSAGDDALTTTDCSNVNQTADLILEIDILEPVADNMYLHPGKESFKPPALLIQNYLHRKPPEWKHNKPLWSTRGQVLGSAEDD